MSDAQSHLWMEESLSTIADRAPDDNIFVGDRMARMLRDERAGWTAETPVLRRWLKTYQLAKAELHLGNEMQSLQLYDAAFQLIQDQPEQVKLPILRQFYFDIGVAHLRWAETENCCARYTPESCILPIQGAAIHRQTTGSRKAQEWFRRVLAMTEADDPMHLASRWLLNLAAMTLGEYPRSVVPEHLIPGLDRASPHSAPPWKNVAQQSGVATFSLAGGAIADDFDNDGYTDLVVSSSDPRVSLRVFWNRGDGTFEDGTAAAQVSKILGGLNLVQTDYNNDGKLDLFVMRGGWLGAAGRHPNSLLKNNGDRTFTDVTARAGLALPPHPTQTAAWADYDLDGDLDLYVGNESTSDVAAPSQLFRNEGDGTFRELAGSAGVTNDRLAKAVAWGDFDGDRYPDLYVSNYRGANRLYRNRGDGSFEDVAKAWQVTGPLASFPAWFMDVDQDGKLDLFVAGYAGGIAELAAAELSGSNSNPETRPHLYLQRDQQFEEVAESWGLNQPVHPMGANFADLHNLGWQDLYLGTGWPEYHEVMPNRLYHHAGNRFLDITADARVGHLQKGHAVAMADWDRDGDLDIFEQMGGFVPGDKFFDVLYQNPMSGEHAWLSVSLQGTVSNRPGIGARIEVHFSDQGERRTIYRQVSSGGSFGANPLEQHFGLGKAPTDISVAVFWPKTGKTDVFKNIPPNSRQRFVETVE